MEPTQTSQLEYDVPSPQPLPDTVRPVRPSMPVQDLTSSSPWMMSETGEEIVYETVRLPQRYTLGEVFPHRGNIVRVMQVLDTTSDGHYYYIIAPLSQEEVENINISTGAQSVLDRQREIETGNIMRVTLDARFRPGDTIHGYGLRQFTCIGSEQLRGPHGYEYEIDMVAMTIRGIPATGTGMMEQVRPEYIRPHVSETPRNPFDEVDEEFEEEQDGTESRENTDRAGMETISPDRRGFCWS